MAFEGGLAGAVRTVGDKGGGVAGPDFVRTNILANDASRADYGAFADGDARTDVDVGTDVDIGANGDWFGDMRGEPPVEVRTTHDMVGVADNAVFGDAGALADVQDAVALNEGVVAYFNVVAKEQSTTFVGAQGDVFLDYATVAELDVALDFEAAATELHVAAEAGATSPESPAPEPMLQSCHD